MPAVSGFIVVNLVITLQPAHASDLIFPLSAVGDTHFCFGTAGSTARAATTSAGEDGNDDPIEMFTSFSTKTYSRILMQLFLLAYAQSWVSKPSLK